MVTSPVMAQLMSILDVRDERTAENPDGSTFAKKPA